MTTVPCARYGHKLTTNDVDLGASIYLHDHDLPQVSRGAEPPAHEGIIGGVPINAEEGDVNPAQAAAADGTTTTVRKHYLFGGQRIALWTNQANLTPFRYLHADHLGSTVMETCSGGAKCHMRGYHAFGSVRGVPGGDAYLATDHAFTGQKADGSGLYYYNARYYDPVIGQFVSPDTIVPQPGRVDGYNRYMYVIGNPLNYSDPSGHDPWWAGTAPGTQHGDPREYAADHLQKSAYAPQPGPSGPSLLERLAPDVVIYGAEGEMSVVATLSGGRYTIYDFENLRKVTLNGFGGGLSGPGVSAQVIQGIGYYQSNDPVFADPSTALAGQALEGSVSAGELVVYSLTYGDTGRYVDNPAKALRYGKAGLGVGAGAPVNVSAQGTRSYVVDAESYRNVAQMTAVYTAERRSNWIGFMQRFRQPEAEGGE